MLKKPLLVLLAQRAEIAVMYHRDLEYIFQDTVRLVTLTVDDDPKIQAEILGQTDVLLITNPEIADHVRHLVSESCQILFLQFTFTITVSPFCVPRFCMRVGLGIFFWMLTRLRSERLS